MNFLLFEIEVLPVYSLYLIFVTPGIIGGALGLVRWWLGGIWLLGPLLFWMVLYWVGQYDDLINPFYDYLVRHEGRSYIIHSVLVPVLSVMLNVVGIGFGLIRQSKLK